MLCIYCLFTVVCSLMADSTSTKEYRLKATSAENVNLRAELEAALKAKENALSENRYL